VTWVAAVHLALLQHGSLQVIDIDQAVLVLVKRPERVLMNRRVMRADRVVTNVEFAALGGAAARESVELCDNVQSSVRFMHVYCVATAATPLCDRACDTHL
jgi:hypothetical protein